MTQYADYNYYASEYNGNMPEADFNRLAILASSKIKACTFNRIDESNVQPEVKFCTCVIADRLLNTAKSEGKSSESVGPWSVSYINSEEGHKLVNETIIELLYGLKDENGTPLIYRGC